MTPALVSVVVVVDVALSATCLNGVVIICLQHIKVVCYYKEYMEHTIDLSQINDITQLKALKSDQYDELKPHEAAVAVLTSNITSITNRISQIQATATDDPGKPAGIGQMQAVNLDIQSQPEAD